MSTFDLELAAESRGSADAAKAAGFPWREELAADAAKAAGFPWHGACRFSDIGRAVALATSSHDTTRTFATRAS